MSGIKEGLMGQGFGFMPHQAYKEYVESNVWKCQNSPGGAHHYVESPRAQGVFICKWCGEHRRFTPNHKREDYKAVILTRY